MSFKTHFISNIKNALIKYLLADFGRGLPVREPHYSVAEFGCRTFGRLPGNKSFVYLVQ